MIRSKFKIGFIFWFLWMLLCTIGLITVLIRLFERVEVNGILSTIPWGMFILAILVVIGIIFKDFKYIQINEKKRTMTWLSPVLPWGRTVNLDDFVGIIKSTEVGSVGEYKTAHLIDRTMTTSIKINGLFYTNFDELYRAIELKEIRRYDMNFWKYLKLIFTGRLKIN